MNSTDKLSEALSLLSQIELSGPAAMIGFLLDQAMPLIRAQLPQEAEELDAALQTAAGFLLLHVSDGELPADQSAAQLMAMVPHTPVLEYLGRTDG